ncbi:entericidin EcnA/B family protein [Donghicola sp. C2-DW-16]|uniref:Entericidin EcnA/B family protein n=1 Tax=Donghicola mangrovi TaxID=2729614 RepID=A0A850Q4H8_9RHOB|nr:entericidin EcnA/B family protein [Donghicola mangrovi]NVO22952.1 entericidin EcnA/B family protein [Donghicola mangrovi]NVO27898.1 entericidin EcnA/B family protein [Donghicola mangrovi]
MTPKTLAVLALLGLLAACNTVEGVGNDIAGGANMVRSWL